MQKRGVLYIGIDESNHGRYPEICVAVFSGLREDCRPYRFPIPRDYTLLSKLDSKKRDYRFLILTKPQIRESRSKTALIAPSLINPYLEENNFDEVRILVDGKFYRENIKTLVKGLKTSSRVLCRGFVNRKKKIKGKKGIKSYVQPFIIGLADITASELYSRVTLRELHKNERLLELIL